MLPGLWEWRESLFVGLFQNLNFPQIHRSSGEWDLKTLQLVLIGFVCVSSLPRKLKTRARIPGVIRQSIKGSHERRAETWSMHSGNWSLWPVGNRALCLRQKSIFQIKKQKKKEQTNRCVFGNHCPCADGSVNLGFFLLQSLATDVVFSSCAQTFETDQCKNVRWTARWTSESEHAMLALQDVGASHALHSCMESTRKEYSRLKQKTVFDVFQNYIYMYGRLSEKWSSYTWLSNHYSAEQGPLFRRRKGAEKVTSRRWQHKSLVRSSWS